jgi:hypothetical protein
VIKNLSILEFAFLIFSSNSFKASFFLESSEYISDEVNGQDEGTGLFGVIVEVAVFVAISGSSLILEEDATASVANELSLFFDCLVPRLPNVLQGQTQLMSYKFVWVAKQECV